MKLRSQRLVLPNGHRVGITTVGEGVPLVFCHGFTTHGAAYRDLLTLLAGGGFRVIGVDMAGHGGTDALPFGHSFADIRGLLTQTLDALGISRAVMVGHSLGGRLVVEFAAAHPERVQAAVLLNAAVGHGFDNLNITPGMIAKAPLRLAAAVFDIAADIPLDRRKRSRYFRTLRSAASLNLKGVAKVAWATKSPRPTTQSLLAKMKVARIPTIVIHTPRDLICTYENGEDAADYAGAVLITVPGFHNWVMADPERCARVILGALPNAVWTGRFAA